MATNQLTPEQQAAFDQFVSDAQEAQQAHKDKQAADTELTSAQLAQQSTTAMDIADHQKALTSAQAFIDLMVPPNPSPPAGATSAGKK